jgi:hypothetical protein
MNHLWGPSKPLKLNNIFPHIHIFNESLPKPSSTMKGVYGFFSAHYQKPNMSFMKNVVNSSGNRNDNIGCYSNTTTNNPIYHNNQRGFDKRMMISGLYCFVDFTLIIVKDGKIIDHAIHGYLSDICEMIEYYTPIHVYYKAYPNDALDCFVNYKYQPFYISMAKYMKRVQFDSKLSLTTFITFCQRRAPNCSFCMALSMLTQYLTPHIPNIYPVQQFNEKILQSYNHKMNLIKSLNVNQRDVSVFLQNVRKYNHHHHRPINERIKKEKYNSNACYEKCKPLRRVTLVKPYPY